MSDFGIGEAMTVAPTEQGAARRVAVPKTVARAGFDVESCLDSAGLSRKQLVFQRNEVIFSQGDPAGNVFYIQKGIVKLLVTSDTGKRAVLSVLGPGAFVGVSCLAGQPRTMATATTMSSTTLRVIPKDEMLRLLRSDRAFSEYFINFLLARKIRITQQVVDLHFHIREKRLIHALLFLAQIGVKNDNDEVTLFRVSQEMLGEMIGTSRTHVSGLMRRLKQMGLVEYDRGLKIHLTALNDFAEMPVTLEDRPSPQRTAARNENLRYPWQRAVFDAFSERDSVNLPRKINLAERAISARLLASARFERDERIALREALRALRKLLSQLERKRESWNKKDIA